MKGLRKSFWGLMCLVVAIVIPVIIITAQEIFYNKGVTNEIISNDPYINETSGTEEDPSILMVEELYDSSEVTEYDISWYDENIDEFVITTVEELNGFAQLSKTTDFEGKTIKLGADITVNTPNLEAWESGTATANPWVSIGNTDLKFNGTFDGQGHTIRGLYVKSDTQYTGLFGRASYDSVIKDFKLVDSYFCNTNKEYSITGSIAGEIRGRMENVYSNAVVVGYGSEIGGMVARINDYDDYVGETEEEIADKVVVKNCWFDGEAILMGAQNTYAGGVVGALIQGDLEMTDCLNTGKVVSHKNDTSKGTALHVGGVLGSQSHAESRLVMNNCLNVGQIVTQPGMSTAAGSLLGRVSGANHSATIKNSFATKESYVNIIGWTNGIVNGESYVDAGANNTAGTKVNRTQLVLRTDAEVNAFFGPTTSAWTYDTVNNGYDRGTPILKYFASWWMQQQPTTKEVSDTSWYNTTDTVFEISTPEQFNGLAELSAKYNFAGQTFKLTADLQMNPVDEATLKAWEDGTKVPSSVWAPIGSEEVPFAGTFDGQGHTISGVYMSTNANAAGLFGATEDPASFKNFKLVDSYLYSNGTQLGGIVGEGAIASMENIYVNATVKTTNSYAGGFVGLIYPVSGTTQISNCWFDGEMIQVGNKVHSVGGFVGSDAKATPIIFKNCLMTAPVSGGLRVGGFIGWKTYYAINEFHNCLSVGTVSSDPAEGYEQFAEPGSYYGHHNTSTYNVKLYNSYATGDRIIGVYSRESEAANFEIRAYLKDRDRLIETGEKTLFLPLEGENKNAWVDDIGQNDIDRGTPVLEMFAEEWFAENADAELEAMPGVKADTSWHNETDTTFTIKTKEELLGLAEIVNSGEDDFAGKTVKLGADIKLNEVDDAILAKWRAGTVVPEVEWSSIGTKAKPFAGIFDGQGYTISGLYLDAGIEGAGLFGHTAGTSEIKNFKFVDSYLKSNSPSLGIIGVGKFTNIENIYTNAIFESSAVQVGGFVGVLCNYKSDFAAIYSTIKNCWFDGTVIQTDGSKYGVGGFVGGTNGAASVGFYNCLSTGTVTGGFRTGGFYGCRNYYALIELRNCLSVANVTTNVADEYEEYANLAGSFFGAFLSNTYNANMYNCYGVGEKINGSTSWPKFETTEFIKTRTELIEAGEKKLFPVLDGEDENAWVNDIGWNEVDRGTPILETFAEWWLAENPATGLEEMPGIKADTSWYNTTDSTFILENVGDLLGFAELVNAGTDDFAGKTVKLGADIKLNEVDEQIFATWVAGVDVADIEWSSIGTTAKPFAGIFDGQGHTISGLYMSATTANAGFFGKTSATAVLKNFKLVDSYMQSNAQSLGLIGRGNFASIENVYSNAVMESTAIGVGGFIGTIEAGTTTNVIKNCWFDGEIRQTGSDIYNVGGFVGEDSGAVPIKFVNCLMTGSVIGVSNVGGFHGFHSYYAPKDYYNCLSVGSVEGTGSETYVGGVVGHVNTSTWNVKMYNTYTDASSVIARTKNAGETDKYNNETYMKLKADLIAAEEAELFPALTAEGETENAWVNDIGYNETDRGTPILATFAEWWIAQHSDDELQERPTNDPNKVKPSTEWFTNGTPIMNAADLLGFAKLAKEGETFAGKTVELGADIALNEVDATILESWVDGSVTPSNVWTPVGTAEKPFAGIFDGQGYTISGLYLDTDVEGAGLFGRTASPSEFKNFKLVDSVMKSSAPSLGIVGKGAVVLMENIYTNAIMISTASDRSDVAGFIGTIDKYAANYTSVYTTIRNCWFDGYVQQANTARKAGGFIAGMSGAASVGFYNCLSTGTVTGGYNVGGFFGAKDTYATCEIKDCLSTATVTATTTNPVYASRFGSFFGDHSTNAYNSKMYTSYGLIKIVGAGNNPATGTVKTHAELVDADVKVLFPDSTAWVQDPYYNTTDRGTPILAIFAEWWLAQNPVTGFFAGGKGTETDPYLITTTEHLDHMRKNPNASYRLEADLVFSSEDFEEGGIFYNNGKGWKAIPRFEGEFDGNNHTISNIKITDKGLFAANYGTIKNLGMKDVDLSGANSGVGTIAYYNYGHIERCFHEGNIVAQVSVGGLVYANSYQYVYDENTMEEIIVSTGVIKDCYNTGSINIESNPSSYYDMIVGGIASSNDGRIEQCYNTGSLSVNSRDGANSTGGISGTNHGLVVNCYNTGMISGNSSWYGYVGGIVGSNATEELDEVNGIIKTCYNIGEIISQSSRVHNAGITIGEEYHCGGIVEDCYYLNNSNFNVDDDYTYCLGTRCSEEQMKSKSTYEGFDFESVWVWDEEVNYPQLQSFAFEKISEITIETMPNKIQYLEEKEQLDLTGAGLQLVYSDGSYEIIDITEEMVSGFDNTKVGTNVIVVTYGPFTTSFEVEIIKKSVSSISVSTLPTVIIYKQGDEEVNVSEGKIMVCYNNDTSEEIEMTTDMISGFDTTTLGEKILTVTYQGQTTSFIITVEANVGDMTGDGVIDGNDVTLLMKYLSGWDVDINESVADVNGDGEVNGKDTLFLMKYLAGWDVTLGELEED